MHSKLDQIFEIESLDALGRYLSAAGDVSDVRETLHSMFLDCAAYSTPAEWNRAVRLCECLAIVGWGGHEAVEAHCGRYFNGYPNTFFATTGGESRYLDAVWFRRDGGIVINPGLSKLTKMPGRSIEPRVCTGDVRLLSQRNWLPKCPVLIESTLANCYPGSRDVMQSVWHGLNDRLLGGMRPQLYGPQLNRILINCAMSFDDGPQCKTNYIIADESLKLRKSDYYAALLQMYPQEEVESRALYLRPRYEIGPFRKDTGMVYVTIVFEKEFSDMPPAAQRRTMCDYFLTAVRRVAARRKGCGYDFALMTADLARVLDVWAAEG